MATGESARVRLLHMRDEIKSLSNELLGLDLKIYQESYALRRITERAIQIISEAARALPDELRARHADAPWADIIAIGNPLRHEYHRIDDKGVVGNCHRRPAEAEADCPADDRGVRMN
jgi:uncharacterized protein with HEPN domain